METHKYNLKGIKFKNFIRYNNQVNVRISLTTSKDEAIDLLSKKLRYSFKDLIIVDMMEKPHHRKPKIVSDILEISKNTLLIYRDIEAYKQYKLNGNYVIILSYGYETKLLDLKDIATCKLMINNFKINFIVDVVNITQPIKRDINVDFETLLNNNPDYRAIAYRFVDKSNNKLIISPQQNYELFQKIITNLVLDVKLIDVYDPTVNPIALYTQEVDEIPINVEECHFISTFDSKVVLSLLSATKYNLSYPRNLYIYIYNVHGVNINEIQNFVLKIDMLKNLTEELLENEIHLLNEDLMI